MNTMIEKRCTDYMKETKNPWGIKYKEGRKISSFELNFIKKNLGTGQILDAAGGTGLFTTLALQDTDSSITILDQDEGMLEAGKIQFPSNRYVSGSCYDMPFKNNFFDGILVRANMMYFTDRKRYMAELARVLKPGGNLVIIERNKFEFIRPLLSLMGKKNDPIANPADFVSFFELKKLLKKSNLSSQFTLGYGLSTPALSKTLIQYGGRLRLNIFPFKHHLLLKPFARWLFFHAQKPK
jgi:SAM-dependent methyltransferase